MEQPKLRGYYERLRHKAAIAAMQSLVLAYPDHNRTATAMDAIGYADALLKELRVTPEMEEC
ncbi:MAG: hypothetical protein WBA99_18235 [Nodosilinea sp.]